MIQLYESFSLFSKSNILIESNSYFNSFYNCTQNWIFLCLYCINLTSIPNVCLWFKIVGYWFIKLHISEVFPTALPIPNTATLNPELVLNESYDDTDLVTSDVRIS